MTYVLISSTGVHKYPLAARNFVATVLRRSERTGNGDRIGKDEESAGADLQNHRGVEAGPSRRLSRAGLRCKGLALRMASDCGRTWDLSFRIKGGGVRRLSLGRYEDVSLEAARQRANKLTSAARQGRDLIAEEKTARDEHNQSFTVERLISEYVKRRVTGRLRTAAEIERRLKRALEPVMKRKAADIRRRDLRQLFDATADRGLTREPGHRRQAIGTMFKWATSQDIIESNPAEGLASYSRSAPPNRVLDEDEIPALWRWLDEGRNISTPTSSILKLQLCLGARCGEVAGMRASEFTKDNKGRLLWTLPIGRSKNKHARVTPILGLALEIITTRLNNNNDILFESEAGNPLNTGLVSDHLRQRRDRLPIDKFTTHDLRRTTATEMMKLGIELDLIAKVVGHETEGEKQTRVLVKHYIHGDFVDRKAQALAAWDRRLRAILVGEAEKGQVLPFQRI
jgi:integrase